MSYFARPILVMFLGVPGSGKTYFARRLADKLNAVRINGDSMRLAIFGSIEEMKKLHSSDERYKLNTYTFNALDYVADQILQRGHDLVYDAHHNKRIDREALEKLAAAHEAVPVVAWIKTPLDIAVKRGQEREATVDQRKFTEEEISEVINRHQANTDEPIDTELVISIDGQLPFEEQFKEFESQLSGSMQFNKQSIQELQ